MMARGKKKESALTPEEKLAQALVPVEEQPYKVPENWCWATLGYAAKFIRGSSPRPIKSYQTESEDGVNWIKIGDTDSGKYINSVKEKITKQGALKSVPVHKGDLLLTNSMSYGKPFILNIDGYIHDGWFALVPSPCIDKEFLYYSCLASEWYFDKIAVGTAVRNISTDRTVTTPIAIPPLAEQRRIVDRIEHLFSKLDEAKEKAQSVLVSFETHRAAILHKAFTGELTAKWRVEHGVEDESWHALTFGDLIIEAKNGTTVKQNKENNDYPVTRIETLQGGTLDFSRLGYIVNPDQISPADYYVAGDIAFSHINSAAHVGKTALIEAGFLPLIHGMNLLRIRLNERCIPEYFVWYSRSADYKEQILQRINMAVNQVSINQKQLKTMPINVPKTQEQREIVRILDSLFAKEQQAKEAAEAVLEKIDLLKKSILARAFRGELGTNDPGEESALELLKSVL